MKTFKQFLNEEIEDYDYEDTHLQKIFDKIKVEKEKNSLTNIDNFSIVGAFKKIKFYSFKKIKEKLRKLFLCSYDEYRGGNSITFKEFKNYVEDEDEDSDIKMYDANEDYSYDFDGRVKIDKNKKLIILGFDDEDDWGEEEG